MAAPLSQLLLLLNLLVLSIGQTPSLDSGEDLYEYVSPKNVDDFMDPKLKDVIKLNGAGQW